MNSKHQIWIEERNCLVSIQTINHDNSNFQVRFLFFNNKNNNSASSFQSRIVTVSHPSSNTAVVGKVIDFVQIPTTYSDIIFAFRFSSGDIGIVNFKDEYKTNETCNMIKLNEKLPQIDLDLDDESSSSKMKACCYAQNLYRIVCLTKSAKTSAAIIMSLSHVAFVLENNATTTTATAIVTAKVHTSVETTTTEPFNDFHLLPASSSSHLLHSSVDFLAVDSEKVTGTWQLILAEQRENDEKSETLKMKLVKSSSSQFALFYFPNHQQQQLLSPQTLLAPSYHRMKFVPTIVGRRASFNFGKQHQTTTTNNNNPQQQSSLAIQVGIFVVLSSPFLLSIYDHSRLVGTIPLPVKYRNAVSTSASTSTSALRRRGDELGATLVPIKLDVCTSTSRSNATTLLFATILYEDFDTVTTISMCLRSAPENSDSTHNNNKASADATVQSKNFYVDIKSIWSLKLSLLQHCSSPTTTTTSATSSFERELNSIIRNEARSFKEEFSDRLVQILTHRFASFICDEEKEASSSSPSRLLFLFQDEKQNLHMKQFELMTSHDEEDKYEATAKHDDDDDEDVIRVPQSRSHYFHFDVLMQQKTIVKSTAFVNVSRLGGGSSDSNNNNGNNDNTALVHFNRKFSPPIFEIEKEMKIQNNRNASTDDSIGNIIISFNRILLEINCWKVTNNSKNNVSTRTELCRFNLKDFEAAPSSNIDFVDTFYDNFFVSSKDQQQQDQQQVHSSCYLIGCDKKDQLFVIVVVYHAELGAQIVPLHRTTKELLLLSNKEKLSVVEENVMTKLHPFVVEKN